MPKTSFSTGAQKTDLYGNQESSLRIICERAAFSDPVHSLYFLASYIVFFSLLWLKGSFSLDFRLFDQLRRVVCEM